MFICKECLERDFKNFALTTSWGKCEVCDKTSSCCDIPSACLVFKEDSLDKNNKLED